MRVLEFGFLTLGLVLLATFFLARGWGSYQSKSGIDEFEQSLLAKSGVVSAVVADDDDSSIEPDYTLWSEKRINDYHVSQTQRDDAPLGRPSDKTTTRTRPNATC